MLVLTRKEQQKIYVGDDVKVTVCEIRGDRVRLGIDAPPAVPILREELVTMEELLAVGTARGYVRQTDLETVVRLGLVTWQQAVEMVREAGLPILPAEVSH